MDRSAEHCCLFCDGYFLSNEIDWERETYDDFYIYVGVCPHCNRLVREKVCFETEIEYDED